MGNKILVVLGMIFLIIISIFLSHYTVMTDFRTYYSAGISIRNGEAIYDERIFSYSIPVAYFFGLLSLLPYHIAKAVFILMEWLMYLGAIGIVLQFNGARGRWFFYPLALSSLWLPFITDIRLANSDCILLFLVAASVLMAERGKSHLAGFLLGAASLFKLFPVAIAMVLGLKNWRILAVCVVTVGSVFLIPGSEKWLSVVGVVMSWQPGLSLPYIFLSSIHIAWFISYVAVIAGFTAWIAYRSRNELNYFELASFAIPATFLTMTIVEYQHMTLLAFCYVYLLSCSHKSNKVLLIGMALSFLIINLLSVIDISPLISAGVFALWLAMAVELRPSTRLVAA